MAAKKPGLPPGRLARAARLLGMRGRAQRASDPAAAARELLETLGALRGLVAKAGQLASYVDGLVPEADAEAYELVLRELRANAERSPSDAIRATVERELGGPIEALFASFEPEPFASASLGQVHRATLADGRAVAVKVQHVGIAEAVESDLKNLAALERLAGPLGGRRLGSREVVALLSARFREELDYRLEATRQRELRRLHAADPAILVPDVIAERSSARVLTSELVVGETLEQAMTAPAATRRSFAETLWRFVFRTSFVGRMFNTDPHPGNYVFLPGDAPRVAFLDFGSVQPLDAHAHAHTLALHRAAVARDEAAFRDRTISYLRARSGAFADRSVAHNRRVFEPVFASPHRITRAYCRALVTEMRSLSELLGRLPEAERVVPPPEMILVTRQQSGFYAVLARLDVEADYAAASAALLAALA